MPEYFDRYINLVGEFSLLDALHHYDAKWLTIHKNSFISLGNKVYEPEKWTVNDIIQHLIDSERIFAYRALCFAREDATSLPAFDENSYAASAQSSKRTLDELLEEFQSVRNATITLFKSFSYDMMMRDGVCFQKRISVLAIGFLIVGHPIHHLDVIKERYFPLLNKKS